jgi:hypothetical protein
MPESADTARFLPAVRRSLNPVRDSARPGLGYGGHCTAVGGPQQSYPTRPVARRGTPRRNPALAGCS